MAVVAVAKTSKRVTRSGLTGPAIGNDVSAVVLMSEPKKDYRAVMWLLVNGYWHPANRARPGREAAKDTRGTKPAIMEVTREDLYTDLEKRRAFAKKCGSKTVYMITDDGRKPASPR